MTKALVSFLFISILLSCGDSGGGSNSTTPDIWETQNVILSYKADISPTRTGDFVTENLFKIPAKIGEGEVAKVSFVFNSKNNSYFKLIRLKSNCGSKDLKISSRLVNLQVGKVVRDSKLEKHTDFAIEAWVNSSTCDEVELSLITWVGETPETIYSRNCEATIGQGSISFKHIIENSIPKIFLGNYTPAFFNDTYFCGEKIIARSKTCKTLIPDFAWRCELTSRVGARYEFDLNYSGGSKVGSYSCKKNNEYYHIGQLTSCRDKIE